VVPRLWSDTVEAHRRDVRDAILSGTWELVRERGYLGVTMSQIAEKAGIGRATLYKYFPDVEAILRAFHERHVQAHLEDLAAIRDGGGEPVVRLEAFLRAFAGITRHRARHGGAELHALLHRPDDVATATQQVAEIVRGLLAEVSASGWLREDVPQPELAEYCLHALTAAGRLPSEEAVDRLVTVTMAGLRPPENPRAKRSRPGRQR
jgi:AcrR family transcriptional regulator